MRRAARRIFLETGDEIRDESQFIKNAVVYVSSGEDFSDPYSKTKELIDKRKSVLWKSDGLHFLAERAATAADNENADNTATNTASRMNKKARSTKRLVAFENGSEFNPSLVVMETVSPVLRDNLLEDEVERLERGYLAEFLNECSSRMKMNTTARLVFNWLGEPVSSVQDVPRLDKCVQPFVRDVEFAPVWVSKGEGFYARASLAYLDSLVKQMRAHQREQARERNKILRNMDVVQRCESAFKSTPVRLAEMQDTVDALSAQIAELDTATSKLTGVCERVQALSEQQSGAGYASLFKHIRAIDTSERIFGGLSSKGIKLKVLVNGGGGGRNDSLDLFFNTKTWFSQDERVQRGNFDQLMTEISRAFAKDSRIAAGSNVRYTRLFAESGEEITQLGKLNSNDVVWASQGEAWVGARIAPTVVSVSVAPLLVMNLPPGMAPVAHASSSNINSLQKFVILF
jgi:polyhydroxyalkanoate synthesis regulator phasin